MPRTASTQKRSSALHSRLKRSTSSSELATTPVLLRLPEIESIAATPDLEEHPDYTDIGESPDGLPVETQPTKTPLPELSERDGASQGPAAPRSQSPMANSFAAVATEEPVSESPVKSARDKLASSSTTVHAAFSPAAAEATSEQVVVTSGTEATSTQTATDKAIADLSDGTWWEHWSSGVVLILLVIALVTASIIAFNDGADTDPSLLAEESTSLTGASESLDLGEIVVPPVSPEATSPTQFANSAPQNSNAGPEPQTVGDSASAMATAEGVAMSASIASQPQSNIAAGGDSTLNLTAPSGMVPATTVSTSRDTNPFSAQAGSGQVPSGQVGNAAGSPSAMTVPSIAPQVTETNVEGNLQPIDMGAAESQDSLIPDFNDGALQFSPEVTQPTLTNAVADVANQIQQAAEAARGVQFSNDGVQLPPVSTESIGPIHSSLSPPSGSNPPLLFGEPESGATNGVTFQQDSHATGSTEASGLNLSASTSTAPQVPSLSVPNLQTSDLPLSNLQVPDLRAGGGVPTQQVAGSKSDAAFTTATHSQASNESAANESAAGSTTDDPSVATPTDLDQSVNRPIETSTPESNADDIIGAYEFYEQLSAPSSSNRYSPK